MNRLRALCLCVCLCVCLGTGTAVLAGCGQGKAESPASPLPSLSAGAASPRTQGQMQASVGHDRSVEFRTAGGQGLSLRVLKAVWRESVIAADGTTHHDVLAVAVQARVTGHAADVELGMPAQLESGNGTTRRSGRFPVAGALDMSAFRPGETRHGWVAFESVDWDALRGNSAPTEARLRMYAYLGEGVGTGVWLVATGAGADGATRRVTLPALGASVDYTIL